MKKHLVKSCVLMAFVGAGLLLPHSAVLARPPRWLTVGLGVGGFAGQGDSQNRIAWRVAVSQCQGPGHFTVHISSCTEPDPLNSVNPSEYVTDIGVLYGKRWLHRRVASMSISAGISLVTGKRRGELIENSRDWLLTTDYYEEKKFTTVGLPLHAQFGLAPSNRVGVSWDLFANLNSERSYVAVALSLIIGQLW